MLTGADTPYLVVTSIHELDVPYSLLKYILCIDYVHSEAAIVNKSQDYGKSDRQECRQSRDHVQRSQPTRALTPLIRL